MVRRNLRPLLLCLTAVRLPEKMKEDIVKWLDPVDNGLKHATVAESRQEGTCAWLFKHPTYLQWMEADHGLLMIHGTRACLALSYLYL